MISKTKAETLLDLQSKINNCKIPKFKILQVKDFLHDFETNYLELNNYFKNEKVAVRSSHSDEDQESSSNAGKFHSVLNLDLGDKEVFFNEASKVIDSYKKSISGIWNQQLLIQAMVQNVKCSGVIFSKNQVDGAPYFVINYDDESGKTDTITGGKNINSNRILYVYRNEIKRLVSTRFINLIQAMNEIEAFYENSELDIEFAINSADEIFVLQVRRLVITKWSTQEEQNFDSKINEIFEHLQVAYDGNSDYDNKKIWGMMPDWNPVELIGRKPKNLAFELFHYCITKRAWAVARKNLGYKDMSDSCLVESIAGTPYVDVEASVKSLIPNQIEPVIEKKMVSSSLYRLKCNPSFHDKYEFEVVISAPSFDVEERIEQIYGENLSMSEKEKISTALWVQFWENYYCFQEKEIEVNHFTIDGKFDSVNTSNLMSMIGDIGRESSVLFSEIARYAFIATEFIKSLVRKNYIDKFDVENFYTSIDSITSTYIDDLTKFRRNAVSKSYLLKKYGHLRQGTFDIESAPYSEQFEFFLDPNSVPLVKSKISDELKCSIKFKIVNSIKLEFDKRKIEVEPNKFYDFLISSIQARELAKFNLSKNINFLLERIKDIGGRYGLSPSDLAHSSMLDLDKLLSKKISIDDVMYNIKMRSIDHNLVTKIKTPELIIQPDSIFVVPFQGGTPNYITTRKIKGFVRINPSPTADYFNNKTLPNIIVLESADPGYDWIFSKNIGGLITRFGGANSHMAIRCSEFSVPAIIGCGEKLFEKIKSSTLIEFDCLDQKIVFNA